MTTPVQKIAALTERLTEAQRQLLESAMVELAESFVADLAAPDPDFWASARAEAALGQSEFAAGRGEDLATGMADVRTAIRAKYGSLPG